VLSELKTLHGALREAIAELAAETAKAEPDTATLPLVRLKLTRASSRRKALIECSISPLLHDISPGDARRIEDLRRIAADKAVESSAHIARWTMRSILADWQGYRRASAEMRSQMLRRINEEAAVLYPLLEARDARQAA
jgi:hypothetical protein